jgi:opacity protein-like surface antigen
MNQCFGMSLGTEFGYNLNESWKLMLSYRYAFDLVNADERAFHGKFRSNTISLGFMYTLGGATLVESYDALSAVE